MKIDSFKNPDFKGIRVFFMMFTKSFYNEFSFQKNIMLFLWSFKKREYLVQKE